MIAVLFIGGVGLVLLTLISVRNLQAGLVLYSDQLAARMENLQTALSQRGIKMGMAGGQLAVFGMSGMSAFLGALVSVASNALISLVMVAFLLFELERFMTIIRTEQVRIVPFVGQIPGC